MRLPRLASLRRSARSTIRDGRFAIAQAAALRLVWFLVLGIAMACATIANAQSPEAVHRGQDPEAALRSAERGTVRIIALFTDENGELVDVSSGSGFVIAAGYVVTNAHVVATDDKEASRVFVIPDRGSGGQGVVAQIVGGSRVTDLALLSADQLIAPAVSITRVLPGKNATVHALGYPGVTDGIRQTDIADILRPAAPYVTGGSIALFSDTAPGGKPFPTIFHTAAINRGNSGGPLIDQCGRVIGVNSWTASARVNDEGVEVPVGQGIASRIGTIMPLLERFGVQPAIDDAPCVLKAAIDPELEARLAAAEKALADAQAVRAVEAAQRADSLKERVRLAQSIMAAALIGAIASAAALAWAIRRKAPTPYRVAAFAAAGLFAVVTIGAYLYGDDADRPREPAEAELGAPPVDAAGPSEDLRIGGATSAPPAAPRVASAAASFDCDRARSFAETAICASPDLAARDASMAKLYARALDGPMGSAVRASATARWREREACLDIECVVAWYDRREVELSRSLTGVAE